MTTSTPRAAAGAPAGAPLGPAAVNRRFAVLIEPPHHRFWRDGMFDSSTNPTGGDDLQAPWRHLKAALEADGLIVHTSDFIDELPADVHKLFFAISGLGEYDALARRPDVTMSGYMALECPVVEPTIYRRLPRVARTFKRVLNWSDTPSLLRYTKKPVQVREFLWPQSYDRVHPQWHQRDRSFLVMINSNKLPRLFNDSELYTARLRAVEYFDRFGEVDLFGPNWGKRPNRVGKTWLPFTAVRILRVLWNARQRVLPDPLHAAARRAHRGIAQSKADTLARYDFALCFENQIMRGWMTEKMFDCLFAGTVPVYWGAPDVTDHVPADAFVDMREFSGFADLRAHLKAMPRAQIERHREAGRAFVESDRFAPFRMETFSRMFAEIVREDVAAVAGSRGA